MHRSCQGCRALTNCRDPWMLASHQARCRRSVGLKCKMDDRRDEGMILAPGARWPPRSAGQKSRRWQRKSNQRGTKRLRRRRGAIVFLAGDFVIATGDFSGWRSALASPRPAPGSSRLPSDHPCYISAVSIRMLLLPCSTGQEIALKRWQARCISWILY